MAEDRLSADPDCEGAARQAFQVDGRGEQLAVAQHADSAVADHNQHFLQRIILRIMQVDLKDPAAKAFARARQRHRAGEALHPGARPRWGFAREGPDPRRFTAAIGDMRLGAAGSDRGLGSVGGAEADEQVVRAVGCLQDPPRGRPQSRVCHARLGFEIPLVKTPVGPVRLSRHRAPHLLSNGV
jgi:hypothetical protein